VGIDLPRSRRERNRPLAARPSLSLAEPGVHGLGLRVIPEHWPIRASSPHPFCASGDRGGPESPGLFEVRERLNESDDEAVGRTVRGQAGALGAGGRGVDLPRTPKAERGLMADHIAVAKTKIKASPEDVWAALTDPKEIEKYMFGSQVQTDWERGSPITWKGEYEGKEFEDHGKVLEIERPRRLKVTHFSPMSGKEDLPENYHTILYELEEDGGTTTVRLSQDNNASADEAEHSQSNWEKMLSGLKDVVERE
jgi:uncharacterized protein YndB with AHSA1/START domain